MGQLLQATAIDKSPTPGTQVTVAACLIARNCEQQLPGCLSRIAPFVDEVVVICAGSTDRSPIVAREYGAQPIAAGATDEIESLRSLARSAIRSEWMLWLDPSDWIDQHDAERIRSLLSEQPKDAEDVLLAPEKPRSAQPSVGAPASFWCQRSKFVMPTRQTTKTVIDVIVLSYCKTHAQYEMTRQCFHSLRTSETEIDFNLVVVETNTAESLRAFSEGGAPFDDRCTVIHPNRQFNYNEFLQLGFQRLAGSDAQYLLIANNDVIFGPGFARALIEGLGQFDSVSPWCPKFHQRFFNRVQPFHPGYRTSRELCGWALMFQKKLLRKISFEAMFPRDFSFWFQDNYYAHQLRRHGLWHALVSAAEVEHLFEQSHGLMDPERRAAMTVGAHRIYEEKTGLEIQDGQPLLTVAVLGVPSRVRGVLPDLIERLDRMAEGRPVEVLALLDNKRRSVGAKRNALLTLTRGQFVSFVDDDDLVDDGYVDDLLQAIKSDPSTDCIVFDAWVTQEGSGGKVCHYGIEYKDENRDDAYYRRPNHICCFRAEIARHIGFPDANWQEDCAFAAGAAPWIRQQVRIPKILYHYRFSPQGSETYVAPSSRQNGESKDLAALPGGRPTTDRGGWVTTGTKGDVSGRPVYGFWHVATMNHWREVVDEQLLKLRASGLLDRTERIFIGVVGPEADRFEIPCDKFQVIYRSPQLSDAEFPTLDYLRDFAERQNSLVYYFHTKGVSHANDRCRDWRHLMEHFSILRYDKCIGALADHDTCGVNWHLTPTPHYSGNVWWARSEYVSQLGPARINGHQDRLACERWIGSNPNVRAACLHESDINHYLEGYPRVRYATLGPVQTSGAFEKPSAWKGLENRFQDLVEPIGDVNTIVEIGVEYGYSLFALAAAAPRATIIGVDPYGTLSAEESATIRALGGNGNLGSDEAEAWVQEHLRNFPNVRLLRCTGQKAAALVDRNVDVVHLDAVPTYEEVAMLFAVWEPHVRPGGCILFHDTVSFHNDIGRFFRELPGRKAEIRDCHGLGAWYKPTGRQGQSATTVQHPFACQTPR